MADIDIDRSAASTSLSAGRSPLLLAGLVLVAFAAYAPTALSLASGPWQTEQEGHGPFILAIAAWAAWRRRAELKAVAYTPAPLVAWLLLAGGAMLLFLGRSQQILAIETFSLLPILVGVVLLVGGWQVLKILRFPVGILFFAVPPPGWLLDALTLPWRPGGRAGMAARRKYVSGVRTRSGEGR